MDDALLSVVLDRLDADEMLDEQAGLLVLAACEGELDAALREQTVPRPHTAEAAAAGEPPGAYLASISVEGFRGIGPEQTLQLTPGPGFTLVVGRNGSGKSSFAEGLELLLTGDSLRWQGRAAAWKEGWRNLHHPTAHIEADLVVEGKPGSTTVRRTWEAGDDLGDGTTVVQPVGQPKTDLTALGWVDALATYRPFLSYNELGSLLEDGPSKLYDALESILGLDELNAAGELLRQARLQRERALKDTEQGLSKLLPDLAGSEDPRAGACHEALAGRQWDLDRVEEVLADRPGDTVANLDVLRALAALEGPDTQKVEAAVSELREAADAWDALAGTDSADADRLAGLLEQALTHHDHIGDGDCPVCGRIGALDEAWREATAETVTRLRETARQVRTARERLTRAERDGRALVAAPPAVLSETGDLNLNLGRAPEVWQRWRQGAEQADDGRALADHLEEHVLALDDAVAQVRQAASEELDRRQAAWQPLASRLATWYGQARTAVAGYGQVGPLKAAERWLKEATAELRDERFTPIAADCQAYWEQLRQHSNVELGGVQLAGSGPRRRVDLDVTVDGVEGAAVGVMSQGELHALALSLFLPRATLPESPFRFLVIDDPVQSMDPTRVDGLARVLATVAEQRQIVVFTHDDRLAESVRRLDLPARVLEVTRRAESVVEVGEIDDPIDRLLGDARALASTDDLPPEVGRQVVPGFCRAAMEAACAEAFRRRRLVKGETHLVVEDALGGATTLTQMAALALFNDRDRAGDVLGALGRFGPRSADAFKACDKGAHRGYSGDLHALINDAEALVKGLRRQ